MTDAQLAPTAAVNEVAAAHHGIALHMGLRRRLQHADSIGQCGSGWTSVAKLAASMLLASTLVACSDSDPSVRVLSDDAASGDSTSGDTAAGVGPASTANDMASIAGLYDASIEFEGIGRDAMALRVSADGSLIEYDYQDDDVDKGADCNLIRRLTSQSSSGGLTIDDGNRSADFQLRAVDSGLEFGFVDVADLDGDGDNTETLRTVLERIDDVAVDLSVCP